MPGSGDDDEDDGLEDSSAETEKDQVYFSRGEELFSQYLVNLKQNVTYRLCFCNPSCENKDLMADGASTSVRLSPQHGLVPQNLGLNVD